jgi:hypothetical protein
VKGETLLAQADPTADQHNICDSTACSSTSGTAQSIATKINRSTSALLQGITAVAVGSTVELYGQLEGDHLEFNGTESGIPALPASQLGKVFISNGRWHLPIIASTTQEIAVISGNVNRHLRGAGLALNTTNILNTGATLAFDSGISHTGELVIARISADVLTAGRVFLHRYVFSGGGFDPVSVPAPAMQARQVFGTRTFEEVKLGAAQTGNNSHWVLAKESGTEYWIGRFPADLSSSGSPAPQRLIQGLMGAAQDWIGTIPTDIRMLKPQVFAARNTPEARIIFQSTGTTPYSAADPHRLIMAKVEPDYTVRCGACVPLVDGELNPQSEIGVSVLSPSVVLGSQALNNTRDIVVLMLGHSMNPMPVQYDPVVGIFNVQGESIQATAVAPTDGLFRPAFMRD